jgi:hypothetical protein
MISIIGNLSIFCIIKILIMRTSNPSTIGPEDTWNKTDGHLDDAGHSSNPHNNHSNIIVKGTDISDGCGIQDGVEPVWLPYSSKDLDYMNQILHCVRTINNVSKLQGLDKNILNYRNKFNLTYLSCNAMSATPDTLMTQYDNIYMIGDSVLRQQFNTLLCMINPQLEDNPKLAMKRIATKRYEQYHAIIPRPKSTSRTDNNTIMTPPLRIIYTTWGYTFEEPRSTWPLFREFPILLQQGTHRDIIILNAGHHYRSPDAAILWNHTQTIVNLIHQAHQQARIEGYNRTIPHVYVIETADENYPTSNGLFPGEVCLKHACTCRAVSREMELGRGSLDPTINWTGSQGLFIPDHKVLWNVTTRYDPSQPWNHSSLGMDPSSCIPDCYPADWRSRLTLPILLQTKDHLHVVPIWRQLVRRGIPNNVSPGDCTHKGVDVIMELNRQLFRAINKVHSNR